MARLARASAIQFGANILKTAVGALVTLYFVNVLGVSEFGRYTLAVAVVNWLLLPSTAIRAASIKRISEGDAEDRFYSTGLFAQLFVVLLFAGAVLLVRARVNAYVGFTAAGLVAVLYITLGFAFHFEAVIRAKGRYEIASFLQIGRHLAKSGTQFVLLVLGGGVVSLLSGEIIANIAAILVGVAAAGFSFGLPDRKSLRSIYSFGKYAWLGNLKGLSYSWIDTIILGFFVSPSIVGAYEISWRISALFTLLPSALTSILLPSISRRSVEDAHREASQVLRRGLTFAAAIAIPGTVGALILGREILSLYGSSVTAVSIAPMLLVLLSIGRVAESFETLLTTTLEALDYPEHGFRVSAVFLIVNFGLNLLLVSTIGVSGAAIATVVSILVSLALAWNLLPDTIDIHLPIKPIVFQVVAAGLMGVLLYFLTAYRPATDTVTIVGYVGLGALCYSALLYLISAEARARVNQVISETFEVTT